MGFRFSFSCSSFSPLVTLLFHFYFFFFPCLWLAPQKADPWAGRNLRACLIWVCERRSGGGEQASGHAAQGWALWIPSCRLPPSSLARSHILDQPLGAGSPPPPVLRGLVVEAALLSRAPLFSPWRLQAAPRKAARSPAGNFLWDLRQVHLSARCLLGASGVGAGWTPRRGSLRSIGGCERASWDLPRRRGSCPLFWGGHSLVAALRTCLPPAFM